MKMLRPYLTWTCRLHQISVLNMDKIAISVFLAFVLFFSVSDGQSAVCFQPRDSGSCYAYFLMWHYNPFLGTCQQFVYGGCDGNLNRFPSFYACMRTCRP